MDSNLKAALFMVLGALLAFGFARLGRSRDRKSDEVLRREALAIKAVEDRDRRIDELERDVERLKAHAEAQTKAAIPLSAALEAMLVHKLTNDHRPEADALLKKHTDDTLTPADAVEFARLMKERETDDDPRIGRAQQIAAEMLPLAVELKRLDEEAAAEGGKVKTVLVTVPETETVAAADGGTQEEERK